MRYLYKVIFRGCQCKIITLYHSKYIGKDWLCDGGEHNEILLIRSKKRGAIQPIPIEVDGLSELVPCHLVKVHAKSGSEGEGEGIP